MPSQPANTEHLRWDNQCAAEAERLAALAAQEDLCGQQDWTTNALVGVHTQGQAVVVAREPGVVAGLAAAAAFVKAWRATFRLTPTLWDGQKVERGGEIAVLSGDARELLTRERPLLNVLGRLSGIATCTQQYVQAIQGTASAIYDTRKTLPGWRRLEKYAVRCGGGQNHRQGLFDAVLIKDNHLALSQVESGPPRAGNEAAAVRRVQEFIKQSHTQGSQPPRFLEVEVDDLEQLQDVLPCRPDVVLLDNFKVEDIRRAVQMRNELAEGVVLEASGGVTLETVRAFAEAGAERIAVGAITHSAPWLDIGLDWR